VPQQITGDNSRILRRKIPQSVPKQMKQYSISAGVIAHIVRRLPQKHIGGSCGVLVPNGTERKRNMCFLYLQNIQNNFSLFSYYFITIVCILEKNMV
ncbi:MAG: hypothetical protein ACI3XM_12200, partial [Eubacteriales bacterium]